MTGSTPVTGPLPIAAGWQERGAAVVRPRTLLLQAVFALVTALVLVVFTIVDPAVWGDGYPWSATAAIAVATGLALALRWMSERTIAWVAIVVPVLDLLGLLLLAVDPQAPRIIAMLAVVPAFWLGLAARRLGAAIAAVAGLAVGIAMALRIPDSSGVTLTANAVGSALVPLALFAAAWFADSFSGTVERQQQVILRREEEKAAIAKQREADAALLDAIFETARVGLLLLDTEGHVVRANPTLTGHPALGGDALGEALEGAAFLELDSRRTIPAERSPLARAARGESFDNEVAWLQRDGHDLFAVTVSSRPLLLDGELRGSIASIDDVTAYMRMLEDRDDFVALVSHELRTPLTSITGYLELALDEAMPDRLRDWLLIVRRNSERLRALVEDLLIVGEMSRGETHLEPERVDLRALARDAVATLEHRARRRGVGLRLVDGPPIEVEADRRRITQVIENYVSNGIKYTRDDGGVEVRVEAIGPDARLRVVDDGPGLQAAEAARVFERFFRSQDARASGVPGAGLGLWICRMIVQAHGGSVDFESEPGRGSTASFRLPRSS
ncbi:sensor histidine kinase [Agrococcus carbonis]|uniref:Sensor-like histidine kinase SenX3 n=1 Tax=Agrococcus carbonis TaxID=684552 RepID=A0A1H1MHJ9_9MICO|nr:ATP-binding protein [Agrococcus carbonis]SDR86311.1 His Kinase A (phospho-acceptor) domain-containing protein [Agrococcus carbonis]